MTDNSRQILRQFRFEHILPYLSNSPTMGFGRGGRGAPRGGGGGRGGFGGGRGGRGGFGDRGGRGGARGGSRGGGKYTRAVQPCY